MHAWRPFAALLALLASMHATAHEVRPAYLELTQTGPQIFDATFKLPLTGGRPLAIELLLPDGCARTNRAPPSTAGNALVQRWRVDCDLQAGTITMAGLERTLTDVLVRLQYADERLITALLSPSRTTLDLGEGAQPLQGYLILGVEHLLFGIDHILFVVGLVLFIKNKWSLLKTVTAFTAAHSVTLALSVMGVVALPQGPVEAVIALSILFLARELVVPEEHRSALTRTRPWLMAFAFGLLHGFGFAGALTEIGLPSSNLAVALLLFNLGIELGQLAVIAIILLGAGLFTRWSAVAPRHTSLPTLGAAMSAKGFACLMGVAAAFWTIERVAVVL